MNSENQTPLVSILIPCYNAEKYIEETLNSVLSQTYQNWECIVVDDHSTDSSFEIVKSYCDKHPDKFKLHTNPGKGACAARNETLKLSKGTYLKFLDADDALFDSNVLAKQTKFINTFNDDIIYGVEYYYNEYLTPDNLKFIRRPEIFNETFPQKYFTLHPGTPNYLIKKSSIENIYWNENLKSGQEFDFIFRCYLKGLSFSFANINTIKIRHHNNPHRISNAKSKEYANQKAILIEELEKSIIECNNKINDAFLENFYIWSLNQAYYCLLVKNAKAFNKITNLLKTKTVGNNIKQKQKIIYKINSINKYIGFIAYYIITKTTRLNALI